MLYGSSYQPLLYATLILNYRTPQNKTHHESLVMSKSANKALSWLRLVPKGFYLSPFVYIHRYPYLQSQNTIFGMRKCSKFTVGEYVQIDVRQSMAKPYIFGSQSTDARVDLIRLFEDNPRPLAEYLGDLRGCSVYRYVSLAIM